jgi:pterin-4a-carbinolamine dehydratase
MCVYFFFFYQLWPLKQAFVLKHHARLSILYKTVDFFVSTHEAILPQSNSDGPVKGQGVTMKDVHLAYLVEKMSERYVQRERENS